MPFSLFDPVRRPPVVIRPQVYAPAPKPVNIHVVTARRDAPAGLRLRPGQAETFALPLANSEDAPQILAYLHSLAQQFSRSPYIREFTVARVLAPARVIDNDQERQIELCLEFVRRNVTYLRDPIDSEYVISPINLLEKIDANLPAYGDCEDHCLLLNSMLGAMDFPTRFVAAKINDSDVWNHVICSVYVSGRWYDLDPIAKGMMQPDYDDEDRLEGQTNYAT